MIGSDSKERLQLEMMTFQGVATHCELYDVTGKGNKCWKTRLEKDTKTVKFLRAGQVIY